MNNGRYGRTTTFKSVSPTTLESTKGLRIANTIFWIVLFLINWYLRTPALTSVTFFRRFVVYFILIGGINLYLYRKSAEDSITYVINKVITILGVVGICGVFLLYFGSGHLFHARAYASLAQIETPEDLSDIPTLDEINHISLMDTKSASKLGNRQLGKMQELVSQFEVSDTYYTISYNDRIYKIAPLEYGGFFKWINNESIPGYVLVDPVANSASYVKVEGGIKYSPSAYFNDELKRHIQFAYPSVKLMSYSGLTNAETDYSEYSFQLDEEGTPYWVMPTCQYAIGVNYPIIDGAILVNASTGAMEKYDLAAIPEWVDLVFCGPVLEDLYYEHGYYLNGYWNFSKKGMTTTTDDFGYLMIGDDICIYTGITSVSGDESNIGFVIANTRTGLFKYYAIAGAEEYSAMSAANGLVQNYGYKASFPSLVMVEDNPTYVMVLKDGAGLIKKYAMVNMENYTCVVVGDSIEATRKAYVKALKNETGADEIDDSDVEVVTDISYFVEDGKVYVRITMQDGTEYTALFAESEKDDVVIEE